MPEGVLEIEAVDSSPRPAEPRNGLFTDGDGRVDVATERRVRDDLRRQIGLLEQRIGELFASAFPRQGFRWTVGAVGGPRVLGIAELERVRDGLAVRLREAQIELGRRGEIEEANRGLLEAMVADPERYRWVRISNEDVGETGCRHWHSRPRWGILGMLAGWWRVKLSSGCPLAKGPRPPEQETPQAPSPPPPGDAVRGRDAGGEPEDPVSAPAARFGPE